MDPTKFENFTKAMATPTSRRRALKGLLVTALGGIAGFGGIEAPSSFAKPTCHTTTTTTTAPPTTTTTTTAPPTTTTTTTAAPCLGLEEVCTRNEQCCNPQGKTICANNGGPSRVCCNTVGGPCTTNLNCCGQLQCSSEGTCQSVAA